MTTVTGINNNPSTDNYKDQSQNRHEISTDKENKVSLCQLTFGLFLAGIVQK
jgi:hypothetical protein